MVAGEGEGAVAPAFRRKTAYRKVIVFNFTAGIILWIGGFTDLSWPGSLVDFCYPPLVALIALVCLFRSDKGPNARARWWYRLACLPSLIGGGLMVLAMVASYIFILPALFALSEWGDERNIQSAKSPDGTRTADVYFRGVGAYAGGNGRVFVRLHYRWLPFVERDVLYVPRSYIDGSPQAYLEWSDNETLTVLADDATGQIMTGGIELTTPEVLQRLARVLNW